MRSALPKVLHPLAGRPLIAYPLALARRLDAAAVAVVHAPGQQDQLAPVDPAATMVPQADPRGTGDALNRVPPELRGHTEVLVLYGDVPLLTQATLTALVAMRRYEGLDGVLLAARVRDPHGYGRVVHEAHGPRIVEEADATPEIAAVNLVNTGVCCFRAAALWPLLADLVPSAATGELYLTDVFGRLRQRAVLECPEEEALGINDRAQLAAAEAVLRRRINRGLQLAGVTIRDPETTWIDAAVRIGQDTVIEPFSFLRGDTEIGAGCHIGPFAEITDSRVGDHVEVGRSHLVEAVLEEGVRLGPFNRLRPGSRIGAGVRIGNFAEIKNSTVGPDSDVHHFSYLGDAVLGRGVNIGAGTVTANYDGVAKHRTVIGDHVFIGTDSTLIAPVRVGDGAYTAAGSVISRDVAPGALAIERGEQREVADWTRRRRRPPAEPGQAP
jgi:bifunctional UDP-N-acetylglucosamine pyrophosphorylase/glucosamine-1-phosphate N-acetyltransferase